jgi:beta-lactamase regulating signal transducer with metallopeptidase domain
VIAKVTLLFATALIASFFARRTAAETRHRILAGAQLAALALPFLSAILPPMPVTWMPDVPRIVPPVANVPAAEIEPLEPIPAHGSEPPRDVMKVLWLAGLALVAATKLVAFARAMRAVRRARPFGRVLISDELGQPATLGRFILLPIDAAAWSAERLRAVLLHEQAHVDRHDTLLGILGDAACAVYWFHPLAWIVAFRARLERERACDDMVISQGVEPTVYAAAMLDVARIVSRRSAAMAMADRSQLEQRIRAILDPATRRRAPRATAPAIIFATLAAAPLLAAISGTAVSRPRSMEPDLLGDWIASPFSERVEPAAPFPNVAASGPDAALIALLTDAASRPQRTEIDLVPERARWALNRVRHGELVAPLIESLNDHDWRVRAYAAWALGYSRDRRATAPITRLLDEPVWRVRAMAAHALAQLADPSVNEVLLALIDDPAWQVRLEVVRYLAATGGSRGTIEAMRADRHVAVRTAAKEALR